jgi:hypothetical protein
MYEMIAVPAETPLMTPDVPAVATLVLLLLHEPLPVASDKVIVPPVCTEVAPDIAAGLELTVTVVVYTVAGLQPVPGLLRVREYVPVAVGIVVGFCKVDEKLLGPLHDHAVALLELAFKVTVPPLHTAPLLVAPVDDGTALTVTAAVYTVAGLQPVPVELTVSEYINVPVAVGVTDGFCKVEVKLPGPLHDHAVALLELAFSVAAVPRHTVPVALVAPEEDGTGLTVNVVV